LTMTKGTMVVLPFGRARPDLIVLAGLLLCGPAPAQAQPFSADLVTTRNDGAVATPAGKVHVFADKVRIETPELADGFFLIDGVKPAAYFVRPAARVYMDARQSSQLTRIFVQVDPGDPCRQWQAMARLAEVAYHGDWRCERAGGEMIGGHGTIAYRSVTASGGGFFAWIDPMRKFPLRIRMEDGAVITAENVRDEQVPAQFFEVPSGLRKFDPLILIQRIKQSDVWVAGEKDSDPSHP